MNFNQVDVPRLIEELRLLTYLFVNFNFPLKVMLRTVISFLLNGLTVSTLL